MGYKLELNEPTIAALADKVAHHHNELRNILSKSVSFVTEDGIAHLQNSIDQNFAAAQSEPLVSPAEMKAPHEDPIEDITGQVDADGLPWDERIHSSNKKKTAKGVWVARRGVDDITRMGVVNELRGVSSQTEHFSMTPVITPPLHSIPAPLGDTPPHIVNQGVLNAFAEGVKSEAVNTPSYTAPAVPPTVASAQYTITDVFGKIQPMFAADMAEAQTYINSITQRLSIQFQVQVQSINDIAGRPEMIDFAMQLMTNDGK
jgi:hypothetical protein